jgi:hypothetical protein
MEAKEKKEIGVRLKQEIERKFSSIDGFAAIIEMEPSNLRSNYLSGKSVPGGKLIVKLKKAGIDTDYVLTGQETIKRSLSGAFEKLMKAEAKIKDLELERNHYKSLFFLLMNRFQPVLELIKNAELQKQYKELERTRNFHPLPDKWVKDYSVTDLGDGSISISPSKYVNENKGKYYEDTPKRDKRTSSERDKE